MAIGWSVPLGCSMSSRDLSMPVLSGEHMQKAGAASSTRTSLKKWKSAAELCLPANMSHVCDSWSTPCCERRCACLCACASPSA